jgi:hypothetical protein
MTFIVMADTPPSSPPSGALWFDTTQADLYIRYTDQDSAQWVPAISTDALGGNYLPLTGGTLTGPLSVSATADPLSITTSGSSWNRVTTTNGLRSWGAGVRADTGGYGISDFTGSRIVLSLDTSGNATFFGTLNTTAPGNLFGTPAGNINAPTLTNTNVLLYNNGSTNWAGIGAETGGSIYFVTGTGPGAPATRLVIAPSGVVTILGSGTLNAGGSVTGKDLWCTQRDGSQNGAIYITGGIMRFWLATDFFQGYSDGSSRFPASTAPTTNNALSCGWGGLAWNNVSSYAFANASDIREKTDVESLPDDCLDLVKTIVPHRYRWREGVDQDRTHWGFIAQHVGEAMQKAGHDFGGYIVGDDENHSEGLAYHELLAVLWQAVTELSAEVEALKNA